MYQLITFDIYSASLDIFGSAVPKVSEVLALDSETARLFFKTWREQQWNFLLLSNSMKDGYRNYRYITRRTLEYAEQKFDLRLTAEQAEELMSIWTSFRAWPEAREVIGELRNRGYQVAMLSNGDQDMLEPLVQSSGIEFDYIFSADRARAYKPNPAVYDVPFQLTGIEKKDMLHVAGSMFDVMGAKAAGCRCAWANRYHDAVLDPAYAPDYDLRDLTGLLNILK